MEFHQQQEFEEFQDPYNGGGVEQDEEDTLLLCDLPIYGDDESSEYSEFSENSSSSSSSSDYEEFFEFSSPVKPVEPDNIVFCGKIIPYKKTPSSNHNKAPNFNGDKNIKPAKGPKVSGSKVFSSSRWFLVLFGLARFPGQVDMRDIKKRQSRGSRSSNGAGSCGSDQVKGKGLLALMRAVGSSGQRANSAVTASFGCVPKI